MCDPCWLGQWEMLMRERVGTCMTVNTYTPVRMGSSDTGALSPYVGTPSARYMVAFALLHQGQTGDA